MAVTGALVDLSPLRSSPAFRRLWYGRVLSGFGSRLTALAVMYQVWQQTHSTVWTGSVGLAQAVPLIGFGLFAGSIVDRVDRRRCYLVATAGQASCSVLLAVQGLTGGAPVLVVLALVAAQTCFIAISGPASRIFVRRLLADRQLAAGLVLNRIAVQAPMLLGPAVGGLVLGWLGLGGCYLIDVASFGAVAVAAWSLPAMRPDDGGTGPGASGVLAGLRFLAGQPVLRGALVTDLAATVLSFPVSLFPLVNAERFGDNPRTLGLFLSAIAVGGVLASAFSGAFIRLPRPGIVMLFGSAAWGGALVLFGCAPDPWLALGCLAVAGAADTVSVVTRNTLVQRHTPDQLLGRVTAAEQIIGQAGPNLGDLRAGLVAGATSGLVSLVSGGLLCVVAVAAVAARTPQLRGATVAE